jgi:hypothetical protein
MIAALVRFWKSDAGLSVFLGLLCLHVFVLPALIPHARADSLAGNAAFAVVLVSGVLALSERGRAWRLLMATAVVSVGVVLASPALAVPAPVIQSAELACFILLLVVVLGQTFRAGPVTRHRILGAVGGYLLFGLAWAEAYELVETLQPGSFSGAIDPDSRRSGFAYFSFVTLTTVGFGDVLPVSPAARSLAMSEAVFGPLYIAILLARLVSLAVTPGGGPGPENHPGAPSS